MLMIIMGVFGLLIDELLHEVVDESQIIWLFVINDNVDLT
jgi:hypothetical protein